MTSDARIDGTPGLRNLARLFDELGAAVRTDSPASALQGVVDVAVRCIDGADAVSLTTLHPDGRYVTDAATSELARRADRLQAQVGSGPCLSAILEGQFYGPKDLETDGRWPAYGSAIARELDVHSMLSYRLRVEVDGVISALNVYAHAKAAFDDDDALSGLVLATHGGLALSAEQHRHRGDQLEVALRSNREIGMAMGVLMNEYKITSDQAFGILRVASQNTNRKLRDVAADVAQTGALEIDMSNLRLKS